MKLLNRSAKNKPIHVATHIQYHDVSLPLGVAKVWVQPVHEPLHLLPVQEDDEDQKQEIQHTQTCQPIRRPILVCPFQADILH